jgi:hypothetical protein
MKKRHLLPVYHVIAILLISGFLQAQELLPLFLRENNNTTEYFAKYIAPRRLDLRAIRGDFIIHGFPVS